MSLYEVTNGYTGESYVRVYVWCYSEADVIPMANKIFRERAGKYGESYWSNLKVKFLFEGTDPGFVTEPSDEGFGEWQPYEGDRAA